MGEFKEISNWVIFAIDVISLPLFIFIFILFFMGYSFNVVTLINVELIVVCCIYTLGYIICNIMYIVNSDDNGINDKIRACIDTYCDLCLVTLLFSFMLLSCKSLDDSFNRYKYFYSVITHILSFVIPLIPLIIFSGLTFDSEHVYKLHHNEHKLYFTTGYVIFFAELIYYIGYFIFWLKLKNKLKILHESQDLISKVGYIKKLRICLIMLVSYIVYVVVTLVSSIYLKIKEEKEEKEMTLEDYYPVEFAQNLIGTIIEILITIIFGFDKIRFKRFINLLKRKQRLRRTQSDCASSSDEEEERKKIFLIDINEE